LTRSIGSSKPAISPARRWSPPRARRELGWWLQGDSLPFALCDFASPRAFGAGGASGCQLLVDPATRTVVVLLTNTHARIGLERWAARLRSIVNLAYLEASHA
jgi:CubicO group peptidase (beta-lactamase class C family)